MATSQFVGNVRHWLDMLVDDLEVCIFYVDVVPLLICVLSPSLVKISKVPCHSLICWVLVSGVLDECSKETF